MPRRPDLCVGIALLLLLAAAGCSDDGATPPTRDEVAVFGYLFVGETVGAADPIHVTRVRPVGAYYDPAEAAVNDAVVTLRRAGGARAETLRAVGPGAYAAPDFAIEERTTYDLRVEIPGDRVLEARTTTPYAFDVEGGPPVLPDSVAHSVVQDTYPMLVACEDPAQIALVDVYCREPWEDARYINPFGDHAAPDDYDEYGGDSGEPRHIQAYFRLQDLVRVKGGNPGRTGDGPEDGGRGDRTVGDGTGDRFVIDFYSAMMAFYGHYTVQVFTIDDNYYRFLYRDHPEEEGGIVGGIGVFGSACRRSWEVRVGRP